VTTWRRLSGLAPNLPDRGYVRALFDWLAPDYDVAVLTYSLAQDLRWKAELIRRLRPRPGERALDLACGTGLIYDRLARVLGPGAVVGLDINLTMLTGARPAESGRAVIRADSVKLPFREAAFDLVTAGYLFKYVPLDRLSTEIRRVLRPGGRFGGYDFSAPIQGTMAGRLYSHYLHQVLPFLGRRLGRGDESWKALLTFLAEVATSSGWEGHVERDFRQAGFDQVEQVPSLGGAITWLWAWLPRAGDGSG
jgi:demethylmenaquinone methyltransferase / 2-methoxy-6-polyprenyl-1,4-benzoquinol methylase